MSDMQAVFDAAVKQSTLLPTKPDNATLLKIYAFYKQATEGDNEGDKPSFTDIVGRAKWDAWTKLAGMDKAEAQLGYVELIDSLR